MENTVFLKNIHFVFFDNWFMNLSEKEQDTLISDYGGLEKYLGIKLNNPTYDEDKGFQFDIVDNERWNEKYAEHEFLKTDNE